MPDTRHICERLPAACRLSGAYVTLFGGQADGLTGSRKRQYASQVAGLAAVTIAATALVGWWAGLPLLSSWGPGLPAMRVSGALSLASLGLALIHPGKHRRFAAAVGVAVALLAAFALGLLLLGVNLNVDAAVERLTPPYGATIGFGLTGAALALSSRERHRVGATLLAGLAGTVVAFALLGYLIGVDPLYVSASLISPPLPAVVGLFCIAIGVILRVGAMPVLRTAQPLWRLLIALGCAIIAPLLLFGAYAGTRVADAQLNQVRADLTGEARTLAEEIDREIIGEIGELQALAVSPSLRHGDFATFQRQAEASLAYRQGGNIMLVDRNMQQLVNTWVPFGTPLEKAAVTEPVMQALATGKPQISSLFTGPATEQLVLGIIVPVQIDGENRYALVRPVDQGALAGLVGARRQHPGLHVAISDAERRIIAQSEQEDASTGNILRRAQWHCPGASGVFEFTVADRWPSLGAYACSELTGWQTTLWEPKALLEAPVLALWRTLGWLALLAFMLVVVLALWLGRIIAGSVGHAAHAATALGEGSPLPMSGTPIAEVNTLMSELRGAAARRHAAERDLQASRDQLQLSKDQLQLAFDATRLGWWQSDPCRSTVSGDARFGEIFDVTAGEVSIDDIMARVHPDDVEAFRANQAAALDPANPKPIAHEYRIRRRNGEVRWLESHGLAHFKGTGPGRRAVSFGGTVQDITERKESEEKEHLLIREINHRAKNMLSVVDAIAHQTATRSPEDFVERFSERVQALSANQDLLVRNEWKGVEIADLVRAQLAHFADLIGSRIIMQGPRLRLNPASAQAIGLALHELATNAGKYGALSTDRGHVDIGWGVTEGDTFTMIWTEREGPQVVAPRHRGFGTVVMETMAKRSVDGSVQLDYPPSGVIWRLTCAAGNVLEAGWMMTDFQLAPFASHDAPA
jgi:PAS domain S-box-containing protein